jgi:hypothetical protein
VQFIISPAGAVSHSMVQASTLGNARVESCVIQATRRWEFPQPERGGVAIVNYPFLLAPAGGSS